MRATTASASVLVILACLASAAAFSSSTLTLTTRTSLTTRTLTSKRLSTPLRVANDEEAPPATTSTPEIDIPASSQEVARGIRAPSSRANMGRSVDQDGKSNIWAVGPKMQPAEPLTREEEQKRLLTSGIVFIGFLFVIALLPQLNNILPDPSEY